MINCSISRSKGHVYGSPRDGDSPGKGECSEKAAQMTSTGKVNGPIACNGALTCYGTTA